MVFVAAAAVSAVADAAVAFAAAVAAVVVAAAAVPAGVAAVPELVRQLATGAALVRSKLQGQVYLSQCKQHPQACAVSGLSLRCRCLKC